MAALEKNNIYTARIEGYSSEGLGIARIDGQVRGEQLVDEIGRAHV